MSTLKTRITEDMKAALKAGEAMRLHTVRLALSEIKRYEADKGAEPDEATALGILEKMVKQRRDSEQQFRAGNRADLADKEAAEIRILLAYMPRQLTEAEVLALIDQGKAETGATGGKDMGRLMAWLKPKAAGRVDMSRLSALVKQKLPG
jgi:hypothetical protein